MPLDRDHITVASKIMLPSYVAFFTALGLTYLITPIDRLRTNPGLGYADTLLSLRLWGLIFLAAAVLMAVTLWRRERLWFQAALAFCGCCMGVFTLALAAAAIHGQASPAAWTWPALVAMACRASYRSLDNGEQ